MFDQPAAISQQPMPVRPAQPPGQMAPSAAGGNPFQAKFQSVIQGATEIVQTLMRMPGIDQAAVKEANTKFSEGMMLLAKAVQGSQRAGGAGGASGPATGAPPMIGGGTA